MSKYYVLNIKLDSEFRKGPEAYIEIMNKLYKEKVLINIRNNKQVSIRRILDFKFDDYVYITGKIFKCTKLENNDWIDIQKLESIDMEIPENIYPNFEENDFFFIPNAHRLCIPKNGKVSITATRDFFLKALNQVVNDKEAVSVFIEQSQDIYEKILNAKYINNLLIKLTPTNDDINDEAVEFMDQQIKEMQAGEVNIKVKPNSKGKLSLSSSVLNGCLGLAKSNGEVTANIINQNDKKEKIITQDHPKELEVSSKKEEKIEISIFKKVMNTFRKAKY
ncbi:MAG: hypothetical protein A2Y41_04730 [Spirochaetes bacterium GWB1_36_13]|nr:MAG: hypothetical protein A2Y41_04730 [Spirochaetes bacterium GWB1_36_13]